MSFNCVQAYSYRKVMAALSPDYHVVAFDWLGKPLNHIMARFLNFHRS